MIGIIGAMDEEVSQIVEAMELLETVEKASMTFRRGTLNGKAVVIVRSGIGKVNAAVCTQILADLFQVDCVINTGIAGSLRTEINIADVVLSSDVLHHDVDATGFGYPLGQIPRMEVLSFNKIPFLILRAISDKADNSATMDYPAFEAMAIHNSVEILKELVAQI